jgi:membrane protein implicated in regulation of membrane protease activity
MGFLSQNVGLATQGLFMADSTMWWILAAGAVALELVSGTFYLLMLALGLVGAALAAHAGANSSLQWVMAAAVGGGAVLGLRFMRSRRAPALPASANRDVNMDVGATVQVNAWNPDGTASVKYRGAQWTAIHQSGQAPSTGAHTVVEVIGSQLLVEKQ